MPPEPALVGVRSGFDLARVPGEIVPCHISSIEPWPRNATPQPRVRVTQGRRNRGLWFARRDGEEVDVTGPGAKVAKGRIGRRKAAAR